MLHLFSAFGLLVGAGKAWATAAALPQESSLDILSLRSLLFVVGAGGLAGVISTFVRRRYALIKRGMDIFLSAFGLLLVSPLLAVAAVLIRTTSPGPAFYAQERLGKNGKIFRMLKLRTMVLDAERATGPVWAKLDDPRVTPVGRLLRKTRFDEVPQLINILRGQMSLIGPRPERPEIASRLSQKVKDYPRRLAVLPGITGLAQVWNQYDETIEDVRRKVKYDLLYIRQMCLTADFGILFRTVYVVFSGQGSH